MKTCSPETASDCDVTADLNVAVLRAFGNSLDWSVNDTKNDQANRLLLRAASLGVSAATAISITREFILNNSGRLVTRDIEHQCRRAYTYIGSHNPSEIDGSRFAVAPNGSLIPNTTLRNTFNRAILAQRANAFPGAVTREFLRARSSSWPECWRTFLTPLYPQQVVLVYDNMASRLPLRLKAPHPKTLHAANGVWFLSNAVDGRSHINAEGKPSWRCAEAVTDFRHLILECDREDDGIPDDWLRFLVLLPMPIRAIYTSGGKSVHALVALNAKSKAEWDSIVSRLKKSLVQCGADHGAISAVRLTRLPFCFRESTGRWQELLYFRPDADGTPISRLEVVG